MLDQFQSEPIINEDEAFPKSRKKRSGCTGFFIDAIETILIALVLFLVINTLSARVRVENVSMRPTLKPGDFLLVNRVAYKLGEPSIGDIVVFHAPGESELDYIKRIIGLPGDIVEINGGTVYVNQQPLYEPYISEKPGYSGTWEVPQGQYFVLGDNRNNSSDSHMWGFVPEADLVGRALLIYWPFSEITILRNLDVVQAVE
jgi:signal peptidase I